MNWEKFTVMSQEAFQNSQKKAAQLGNQELKPEHLLWVFLSQEENIINAVLDLHSNFSSTSPLTFFT